MTTVIVLHGRQMCGADLAPFGKSLGVAAEFVFPDAPLVVPAEPELGADESMTRGEPRGRTWWPVDSEARMRRLAAGPMELSQMYPDGRAEARALLDAIVVAASKPYILVGFSQGGMLAMDYLLHGGTRPAALALLSSTRIAIDDWTPRASALADLPVLVAHGSADAELALRAGELLADFARAAGARVTWLPFDGGHEIPLVVWRALRKLIRELA